jgi:hypothetical protein
MVFHIPLSSQGAAERKGPRSIHLYQYRRGSFSERDFFKSRSASFISRCSNFATANQQTFSRLISELDPRFSLNSFQQPCPTATTYDDAARRKSGRRAGSSLLRQSAFDMRHLQAADPMG